MSDITALQEVEPPEFALKLSNGAPPGTPAFWRAVDRAPDDYARQVVFHFDLPGKRRFGFGEIAYVLARVPSRYSHARPPKVCHGRLVWRQGENAERRFFGPDAPEMVIDLMRSALAGLDAVVTGEKSLPAKCEPPRGRPWGEFIANEPSGNFSHDGSELSERRDSMPPKRTELNERGRMAWKILSKHVGRENAVSTERVAALMGVPKSRVYQVVSENRDFFPQPIHSSKGKGAGYWIEEGEAKASASASPAPPVPSKSEGRVDPPARAGKGAPGDKGDISILGGEPGFIVTVSGPGVKVSRAVDENLAFETVNRIFGERLE